MKVDWTPLRDALAELRAEGRPIDLWWRDDDATEPTRALDTLEELARAVSLPVHLAIVPQPATDALARRVAQSDILVPLVHGWRHVNHAPEGVKKSEFGQMRADGPEELALALDRMKRLFGARLLPVFVPPWNRFDAGYLPHLAQSGYRGVSTFLPREAEHPHPQLLQINTHVDPIAWRGNRDLRDTDAMIAEIAEMLHARMTCPSESEPLGYLTHHLVHSPAIWEFSRALLCELLDGGARPAPLTALLEYRS